MIFYLHPFVLNIEQKKAVNEEKCAYKYGEIIKVFLVPIYSLIFRIFHQEWQTDSIKRKEHYKKLIRFHKLLSIHLRKINSSECLNIANFLTR